MPHELEEGFFVGRPARHGLGTVLREAPSIADALRVAGLHWQVNEQGIYVFDGVDFKRAEIGHKAIVRESDKRVLGVVGARYTPLQNRKAIGPNLRPARHDRRP